MKPQPNLYTLLLAAAVVTLAVTIGVVLYNLMAPLPHGYGLGLAQILKGGPFEP